MSVFARLVLVFLMLPALDAWAQIPRERFRFEALNGRTRWLKIEALTDEIIHFELFESPNGPGENDPIWTSPMLLDGVQERFEGPKTFHRNGDAGFETGVLTVRFSNHVNGNPQKLEDYLSIDIYDNVRAVRLTTLSSEKLSDDVKTMHIERLGMRHVYGVGNLFLGTQSADGDWVGKYWNARGHGNFRFGLDLGDDFAQGGPSISQFPMIFVLGGAAKTGFANYGLLWDQPYKMSWNFGDVNYHDTVGWTSSMWGDQVRWFFIGGEDIKALRHHYMDLVGKPPVPPKAVFGHWTSKFGFNNWEEVEEEVASLRRNDFPLDGVALDLQWFGGSFGKPSSHRMGGLQFGDAWWQFTTLKKDAATGKPLTLHSPQEAVKYFYDEYGVQFMPIEESYVDSRLDDFRAMADPGFRRTHVGFNDFNWEKYESGYLAERWKDGARVPTLVTTDYHRAFDDDNDDHQNWWGAGGMVDWSNPGARRYWHQLKRFPLSRIGIVNHWLDLGEPEMYFQDSIYFGLPGIGKTDHGSVHNLYDLFWARGIDEGYSDPGNDESLRRDLGRFFLGEGKVLPDLPRHFTLSRAGTIGSHRYGGMWSGDVFSNMENLRAHLNSQMHMSLLGVDYYSADTGGFFHGNRSHDNPEDREIVTQWAAVSSLLDTPMRPHGWALEGAPLDRSYRLDRRGDLDSNRANIRRRYELIPYVYSLAHEAHLTGEPVFPPLVYHYEGDETARSLGNVKMIGPSLLFGVVATEGERRRQVYLPRGAWVDYENNRWYYSEGGNTDYIPLERRERVPAVELVDHPDRTFFMVPLFAKAGAIIPRLRVDEKTLNALGRRRDGGRRDELTVRVFAAAEASEFTLYEDDGITTAYAKGQVQTIRITQKLESDRAIVTIEPAVGTYLDAPEARENIVEVVTDGRHLSQVLLVDESSGAPKVCGTVADYGAGRAVCWFETAGNLFRAGSSRLRVSARKRFEFHFLE